jgi:hypothetical protein
MVGIDAPSLHAFLKILSGKGPKYDSDDIDYNDPPCMCYHIDDEVQPEEAPELMPLDLSPCSYVSYL